MKSSRRVQRLAGAVERQDAAVIGQRMQHHGDVLARLHDLVEIADAAVADGAGQRPVHPDGVAAAQQIAPGKIGGGQVVMAGDGDQRSPEPRRHMGDEAGSCRCRSDLSAAAASDCGMRARTARIPGRSAGRTGSRRSDCRQGERHGFGSWRSGATRRGSRTAVARYSAGANASAGAGGGQARASRSGRAPGRAR